MAFEGMDPVVVRDISASLEIQAQAVATVLTVLQQQVDRARTAWQGPGASRFEASWNSQHKQSLMGAHEQLSTMSALLKSEAAAQDKTSADLTGAGGGSGALPTGGAGSGGSGSGGAGSGGSGADGPGGEKKDDDPLAWVDKVGQAGVLAGVPFAAAETLALGRLGNASRLLSQGVAAGDAARTAEVARLYQEVDAGVLTQSQVAGQLAKFDAAAKPAMDILEKNATSMVKLAGEDGGLSGFKYAETLGKGAGVLAVAGDVLTLWRPGATGTQGTLNRVAAGANIVGTAGSFAATLAPTVGLDAGLFAANASLDWVPVAGQVLAVGTAAYLAYEQIPFIHSAVNDAASGIKDGAEWLSDEQLKAETALWHGAENLAGNAVQGAENLTSGAVHLAGSAVSGAEHVAGSAVSGVEHAGGSVIKKISSWIP